MEPKQLERILNFTDFNGTYTLDGLKSYTDYSVYVTVGFVENPQEQISMTVTGKTLAGGKQYLFMKANLFIIVQGQWQCYPI